MDETLHPCPACRHANPGERRFCSRCGAALGDPCCGFRNRGEDAFCGGCGRPRRTASAAAPAIRLQGVALAEVQAEAAVESAAQRRDERRPVHLDQSQLDRMFEG